MARFIVLYTLLAFRYSFCLLLSISNSLVLLICSLVAYLLSSRLQAMISKPILNLAHTADKISIDKNFSIRAVKEDTDEIGHLAERFNEMLIQLQDRDAQRRIRGCRRPWRL